MKDSILDCPSAQSSFPAPSLAPPSPLPPTHKELSQGEEAQTGGSLLTRTALSVSQMKGQEWSVPGSPDDVSLPLPSRATRLALDPEEALEGGADGRGAGSAHAPHHPSMTAQVSLSASASVTRCTGRVLLNLVALCALTLGVVLCTVLSTTPAARIDLLPSTLAPSLSSSFSSAFSSLKGPGLMLSQKTVNLPEEGRVAPLIAPGSLGTGNWRKEEAVVDQVVNDVLFFPPSPGNGLGLGPLAEEREREREGLEAERVIVFGDACGHSRNEVAEILLQSHGWEQGTVLAGALLCLWAKILSPDAGPGMPLRCGRESTALYCTVLYCADVPTRHC